MILFKCDRCGSVIAPMVYRLGFEAFSNRDYGTKTPVNSPWVHPEDPGYVKDDLSDKLYGRHFCRSCIEEITAMALTSITRIFEGGVQGTHDVEPVQEQLPEPADPDDGCEMTEEEERDLCERIAGSPARQAPNVREKYKNDIDGPIRAFWTANPQRSVAWIADEIGVSGETVRTRLKKMGLWKTKT